MLEPPGGRDARPEKPGSDVVRGLTKLWRGRAVQVVQHAPLVSRVLAARGLSDAQAAAAFLHPSLKQLHEPSLMPGLERAAERILAAAGAGERIVIYGDYDVDGVTATAVLWRTLKRLTPAADVAWYVPHRLDEGYGLNSEALREIAASGAKLVVTVDCGVTAVEQAGVASQLGIDLIITDHHNLAARVEDLPKAYAVVHPRHPGSAYPFGDLCGAGVAFKLAWRLATMACGTQRVPEPIRALLLEMLALASLGVVADVVPLVGENRVIAAFGLARIRGSSVEGLRALVEASGLAGENVKAEDVGFKLGPRLNACGRMGHAKEAVELLTTATGERARTIAEALTDRNNERRAVERRIFEEAAEDAEASGMTCDDRRAIVLCRPSWHLGVVGIVCSRLVERFHRPAILLSEQDGLCQGSGRSVEGFSLAAGLEACAARLTRFGGHDMAAGLKLRLDDLPAFVEDFTAHANRRIELAQLAGRASFDCDARAGELSLDCVNELARLGPFGRDNPSVTLRLKDARIAGRPRTLGQGNKHLAMFVADGDDPARVLRIIGWGWGERAAACAAGARIDALVSPGVSTFTGAPNVEAVLVDLRVHQ